MPLPTPNKGEKREKFVSRCIADLTENEKDRWPNPKQRDAICYKQSGEPRNSASELKKIRVNNTPKILD